MPVEVGRRQPTGQDQLELGTQFPFYVREVGLGQQLRLGDGGEQAACAVEEGGHLLGRGDRWPAVGREVADQSEVDSERDVRV